MFLFCCILGMLPVSTAGRLSRTLLNDQPPCALGLLQTYSTTKRNCVRHLPRVQKERWSRLANGRPGIDEPFSWKALRHWPSDYKLQGRYVRLLKNMRHLLMPTNPIFWDIQQPTQITYTWSSKHIGKTDFVHQSHRKSHADIARLEDPQMPAEAHHGDDSPRWERIATPAWLVPQRQNI